MTVCSVVKKDLCVCVCVCDVYSVWSVECVCVYVLRDMHMFNEGKLSILYWLCIY